MVGGLLIATLHTRGDGRTLSAQIAIVAAALILVFLVGSAAFGLLCVSALVGYSYNRISPTKQLH